MLNKFRTRGELVLDFEKRAAPAGAVAGVEDQQEDEEIYSGCNPPKPPEPLQIGGVGAPKKKKKKGKRVGGHAFVSSCKRKRLSNGDAKMAKEREEREEGEEGEERGEGGEGGEE
jgi:hypothetical protein